VLISFHNRITIMVFIKPDLSSIFAPTARSVRSNRGFTLLELLVVLAIIGILAVLAFSAFTGYKENARIARASQELRMLERDIIAYATEAGKFPDDDEAPGMEKLKTLKDPWGNEYVYVNLNPTVPPVPDPRSFIGAPINTDFDLYSKGPNKVSTDPSIETGDGADDIIRAGDGSFAGAAEHYPL
jgi:general secretion pathway protein G